VYEIASQHRSSSSEACQAVSQDGLVEGKHFIYKGYILVNLILAGSGKIDDGDMQELKPLRGDKPRIEGNLSQRNDGLDPKILQLGKISACGTLTSRQLAFEYPIPAKSQGFSILLKDRTTNDSTRPPGGRDIPYCRETFFIT